MSEPFARTELLLGKEAMDVLAGSRVAIFGIGGVGGYACEALCRSGVESFDLVDSDRVDLSNLNRQIIATRDTVGRLKVEVMRERILTINPQAEVRIHPCFFLPENAGDFPFAEYDYVIDAVDTVSAKLELAVQCDRAHTPIISCMGAGNKLDPTAFRVTDIYRTRMDPLARVMRRELKKRGVQSLKVVYSEETPIQPPEEPAPGGQDSGPCPPEDSRPSASRRILPGSAAFVTAVAGLILAGEVVKDLTAEARGE